MSELEPSVTRARAEEMVRQDVVGLGNAIPEEPAAPFQTDDEVARRLAEDEEKIATPQTRLPVVPTEGQKPIVESLSRILNSHFACFNVSSTGTGKTFITAALAINAGMPLLVICPAKTVVIWRMLERNYDIKIVDVISYISLASINGLGAEDAPGSVISRVLRHGYLERTDSRGMSGAETVTFKATEKLNNLVASGVFIVMDEAHYLKNMSTYYKACLVVKKAVFVKNGRSRLIFLSATPFDKVKSVVNFLTLLGVISSDELSVKANGVYRATGIMELYQKSFNLNFDLAQQIYNQTTGGFVTSKNEEELAFQLMTQIIVPVYFRGITNQLPFTIDAKNLFVRLDPEISRVISDNIREIGIILGRTASSSQRKKAPDEEEEERNVRLDVNGWQQIIKFLIEIERLMQPTFAALVRRDLQTIPNCKVIVCVNYSNVPGNAIDFLTEELAEYKPLVISGKVPMARRQIIVDAFNDDIEPIGGVRRLLICTTKTGSESINLHDTKGNAPRRMYLSPTYALLDLHQARGRIYRVGLKSEAYVRIVYAADEGKFARLLDAIAAKSKVLEQVFRSLKLEDVVFPGSYETDIITLEPKYYQSRLAIEAARGVATTLQAKPGRPAVLTSDLGARAKPLGKGSGAVPTTLSQITEAPPKTPSQMAPKTPSQVTPTTPSQMVGAAPTTPSQRGEAPPKVSEKLATGATPGPAKTTRASEKDERKEPPREPAPLAETKVVNVHVKDIRPACDNLEEWMKDPNNEYIGRRGVVLINGRRWPPKDSIWANHYKVKDYGRDGAIVRYREELTERLKNDPELVNELLNLRGKNLGCWCTPEPCHGDVLIELIERYS